MGPLGDRPRRGQREASIQATDQPRPASEPLSVGRGPRSAGTAARGAPAGRRRSSFFQALFFLYVLAALVMFSALVPPFQKADEPAHYYRAVSLASLDLVCESDPEHGHYFWMERRYANLPDRLRYWEVWHRTERFDFDLLRQDFADPVPDERVRVHRWCSLPPVGYVPNAIGVLLGMPFQNPLYGFYLGRALGALFFLAAVVLALRAVPDTYRPLVYLYAALPTVLHQVSSISYDVVQLSLFPLVFACFTRFTERGARVPAAHFFAFVLLLTWAVNARLIAYYPLLLLAFAVPPSRLARSLPEYLRLAGSAFALAVLATSLMATVYLPRAEDTGPGNYEVNASEQVRFVLENPLKFLEASYNSVARYGDHILGGAIGYFGWIVDYGMGFLPYYAIAVIAGLVVYWTVGRDLARLGPGSIIVLAAAILGSVALIFLSLYAVWSPVGGDMVHGLQGRYFVGLLPFGVLLVSQTAALVGKERLAKVLLLLVALMVLYNVFRAIELRHL